MKKQDVLKIYKKSLLFFIFFSFLFCLTFFCAFATDSAVYKCAVGESIKLPELSRAGEDVSFDSDVIELSSTAVTGKKVGKTTLVYSDENGSKNKITVKVYAAPKSITLKKTNVTIGVGEEITLKYSLSKNSYCSNISFSVKSKDILSSNGNTFKALKKGKTTVTVKTFNGKTAKCTVTVLAAPKSVSLNKTKITLGVGESFNFNSKLKDGTASYHIYYEAKNNKILEYSKNGIFKALKKGKTTVTVKTYNGKTAKCTVTVLDAPKSVSLNKTSLTLGVGESFNFNSKLKDGTASYHIYYEAKNKKILEYSKNGIFKALKEGKTTVTVKTYNGKTATCSVTVLPTPEKIYASGSSYTVQIGHSVKPAISYDKGYACSTFKYTSSDSSVVSVEKSGKLTGRKIGSAKITVTATGGAKTTFNVRVKAMSVPYVSQFPDYPTGCEGASCCSLLRYYGYNVSLSEAVNAIPHQNIYYKNGKRYGPDINKCFVGNPRGSYTSSVPGYGAFSPIVTKSLQSVIDKKGGYHTAKRISGCTFKELLNEVSNGHPAIVWATYKMLVPQTVNSWYIIEDDGSERYFEYPRGTHVMILTGYTDSTVTVVDPCNGTCTFNINTFQNRWNLLGKQAIVLYKN